MSDGAWEGDDGVHSSEEWEDHGGQSRMDIGCIVGQGIIDEGDVSATRRGLPVGVPSSGLVSASRGTARNEGPAFRPTSGRVASLERRIDKSKWLDLVHSHLHLNGFLHRRGPLRLGRIVEVCGVNRGSVQIDRGVVRLEAPCIHR